MSVREMPFRTEFHVHTRASRDSLMGKHALFAMCRLKHIGCVAITDHDELSGALAVKPWMEARGVSVIPGEEVMTSEGEIIGLWLSERVEPGLTPEETVAEIRRQGGAVYVPHPYDEKRWRTVLRPEALRRVAGEVDCIEVHNGRNADPSFDEEQERIANELGIPAVIGADAHCFFEVGRNAVVTSAPFTREGFAETLSSASFEPSPCHPLAHAATRAVRVLKMVSRGDFGGVRRALVRRFAR